MNRPLSAIAIALLVSLSVFAGVAGAQGTVTFDGEVSLEGDPATDGTQYRYNVSELDAVDNFSIDVTGSTASANMSTSGSLWANNGDTVPIDIGGNVEPSGPGGEPELVVDEVETQNGHPDTSGWDSAQEYATTEAAGKLDHIQFSGSVYFNGDSGSFSGRYYVAEGDVGSDVFNTEPVGTFSDDCSYGSCGFNGDTSISDGGVYTDGTVTFGIDIYSSTNFDGIGPNDDTRLSMEDPGSGNLNMTVSDGQGASVDVGSPGSYPIDLSTSSTDLSFEGEGAVDWTLNHTARSETRDPTIEVNGHTTSHPGTLADGETTSLSTDESWVSEGTNRINVSMASPPSGPTPQVGLDYSHGAVDEQSVGYDGETWSERYNVSKTFASPRTGASLTIPFSSDRVVGIRGVEHRVDDGSWQSVTDYQLNGTELTVDLGDVAENEMHAIRATGTKVKVSDGSITVTDPTWEGNDLDSEVRVDSAGPDFGVDVSGTEPSRWVHYSVEESWQGDPSAVVSSDGSQTLAMEPPTGATMRLRTVPIETIPTSGSVEVSVEDAEEPRFSLSNHSSDVNVTYHDTVGGETYALIDAETGDEVMRDQAESPVSFWAPAGAATYLIDVASSTSGGTNTGVPVAATGDGGALSMFAVFAGLAGSIAGFFVLGRRFGARGWRQHTALIAGGAVVGVVAIEAVTAQSLLGQLAEGGGALVGGALGGFIQSGAGAVVSSIGMFWAAFAIYQRFNLPQWLIAISGLGIGVFMFENITDGALGSGLAEVAPLLWLGVVFGGLALLYRLLAPRPIKITGDS